MPRAPTNKARAGYSLEQCEALLRADPFQTEVFFERVVAAVSGKGGWLHPAKGNRRKKSGQKVAESP